MKITYLDSSAIVKLIVEEPESAALHRYLRRRRGLVSSGLARTEVLRSVLVLGLGPAGVRRGQQALARFDLRRVSPNLLEAAGLLQPPEVRSLDAIHLATALQLEDDLGPVITYDERMAEAARSLGLRVVQPS